MEKKVYDLKIDPDLSVVTPPLSDEAYENLRVNILENGCRLPLIVWNGVIIDGHNRYRICRENNIPFAIEEVDLADKDEAIVWIIENQCCRRNMQPFARIEMVAKYEDKIAEDVARKKSKRISAIRNGEEVVPTGAQSERTRDIAAELAGVSHSTYARGKWLIERVDESTKQKLRQDELKIGSVYRKMHDKEISPREESRLDEEEDFSGRPEICSYIDHPTEDPVMHTEPEREQGSYQFVKDQVEFAIRNMIADMKVGVYCLSNDDFGKKKELKAILREGFKQAADIIDRLEKM